jgi:hypothetical protein
MTIYANHVFMPKCVACSMHCARNRVGRGMKKHEQLFVTCISNFEDPVTLTLSSTV